MEDGREQPPDRTPRAPLAGVGRLSPVQEAWAAFTGHSLQCDDCRDPGRTCETAETLWRTYRTVSRVACERIADAGR